MAEGNQNIMEKAEARFMDKQKKTAERNKATAEYVSEAKAREHQDGKAAGIAAGQGRGRPRCGSPEPDAEEEAGGSQESRAASTEVKS